MSACLTFVFVLAVDWKNAYGQGVEIGSYRVGVRWITVIWNDESWRWQVLQLVKLTMIFIIYRDARNRRPPRKWKIGSNHAATTELQVMVSPTFTRFSIRHSAASEQTL